MEFPILLYHGIHSEQAPYRGQSDAELEWVISARAFERQMSLIAAHGFEVVTLDRLGQAEASGCSVKKPLVLTFDDGHETNYLSAFPILSNYGFAAEIFVTSGWMGKANYMSVSQLRELHEHGFSIQSHGVTHRFLSSMDKASLRYELAESRQSIAEAVGAEVRYLSYPGGRFDDLAEGTAAEVGYCGTCTSERGWNRVPGSLFRLKRQGVTCLTTDEEFRAIITQDLAYFRRREWRRSLLRFVRLLVREGTYHRLRRIGRGLLRNDRLQ